MSKEKLFSVTLKDCEVVPYRGSGSGGQKRNKTSSAIQIKHPPSNATAKCESYREQHRNKKEAFRRMTQTTEFKNWIRLEASRKSGELTKINKQVDYEIKNKVKVEGKSQKGLWEEL